MPVYFLYIDHCLKIGNHLVYNIKLLPPQQFLESKFCHRFTITSNSRCYYISKISEQEGGLHWFCLRKLFSSRALIQEKSSDGFALLNVFCTLLFLQNFCETLDASSEWDSFAVSLLKLTKIHFRLHSVTYSKTPTGKTAKHICWARCYVHMAFSPLQLLFLLDHSLYQRALLWWEGHPCWWHDIVVLCIQHMCSSTTVRHHGVSSGFLWLTPKSFDNKET